MNRLIFSAYQVVKDIGHSRCVCNGHRFRGAETMKLSKINETMTRKKAISAPVDIALQTVKKSGPSERNVVQDQICKCIRETLLSLIEAMSDGSVASNITAHQSF